MTEEQKKKCEEFIKLTISSFEVVNTYENMARDLVMYLAKVFNKDITKEKADYIVDEIIKNEPIQYGSGYEALAYIIERIGWITAEYFDREENINNIDLYINNKFMTEGQKRKCEEIINSYEERYKKDFEKINTLGFHIDGQHTSPIVRMFGIIVGGISAFEFEFGQSEDYLNEYSEFLVKSNNIAGENIIDLTVALSEVFNINMTKEEAEKLLFTKDIEEGYQGDWQSKYSDKFYKSTKEFEHIIEVYIKNSPFYNSKLDTIFSFGMLPHNTNLYMFIFDSVGWAITNYFDNGNKEANKINKINKINNVVKNTAKEKIMTEEQKKKIEEIYNSYNFDFRFLLIKKDEFIKITISLAKVFNRDITEEEAEKIISINKVISGSTNPIKNNIATFWAIVNYFDKGFDKKQEQKKKEATKIKEIINLAEEKYKKDLEELLRNFHDEYVPWALLFHYGDADTIYYWYNPIEMLFGYFVPLSFTLSQMEGKENEFFEFLGNSKDKAAEIIIDITVSLSEIFNKNMTKEEVEKLLFIKNDIEKEDMGAGIPAGLGKFCVFTEEFRKIIEEYYEKDKYGIERVILAIADYFDGKENNNNENEEKNKNFNKENKINNVVENTAKEKIMTEEQKKKCEEIINSYKTKLGEVDISLLINPFSSIFQSIHQYAVENITYMTISLAKVFNKDISEEEAKKIIFELKEDLKENRDDEKYKDFESMSWAIVDKLDDELILNLLILGQTGVGKSSLLNKLAGKKLFKTADDKEGEAKVRPNTDYGIFLETVEIDGKKVNVYDSWGIERNKAEAWKKLIDKELEERSVDKDIKDWFHSVTFCISPGKNGIEYIERDIIKKLLDAKYNVIVALTQADYGNKEENDKLIDIIKNKTGANIVIPISANPKKSMIMTEAPKPFGLEEYKAAILVSWERIFTYRMPLHIIEKLKKDIENAKKNAPNRKPKDDDDLKKLAKEIDEYFINIINKKLPIHIKENFEKYNKITENIIDINTNIDISNFYSKKNIDPHTYIYDLVGFNLFHIFEHIRDLVTYLGVKMDIEKYINNFIDKRVEEAIKYISKKEFEDNIRKIIIYNLENKNKN